MRNLNEMEEKYKNQIKKNLMLLIQTVAVIVVVVVMFFVASLVTEFELDLGTDTDGLVEPLNITCTSFY